MTVAVTKRIEALHGLRGLAVLFVVLSHIGNAGMQVLPIPHNAIGKVGVYIFFGLSAFLLTARLREEIRDSSRRPATVARYLVHRVFRIFPLYSLVVVLHYLEGNMTGDAVVRHLLLVQGDGELWAIPTEFQYYVIVPVVAWLAIDRPRLVVGGLIAALAVSVGYGIWQPEKVFGNGLPILPKLAPFLLGSGIALHPCRHGRAGLAWASLVVLLACTIAYRGMYVSTVPREISAWLSLGIGVSVAALMNELAVPGRLARIFSFRPLVWMGEISFSVYLLHMFVVRQADRVDFHPAIEGVLVLVATTAISSLTYLVVERPGVGAGKFLGNRIAPSADKESATATKETVA